MKTTLHWNEDLQREPYPSRSDYTPQGPQMFTEQLERDRLSTIRGTVVRLEYDVWQALGGPTTIEVEVR
jgi:hypothetical protein